MFGEITESYLSLSVRINKTQKCLHQINVCKGDVICLIANKNIGTVQIILAAFQAGVIVVPINPTLKPPQILQILDNSKASTLFCTWHTSNSLLPYSGQLANLANIVLTDQSIDPANNARPNAMQNILPEENTRKVLDWDDFYSIDNVRSLTSPNNINHDDSAVILYTSGSTGEPKGVVFSYANLEYGALSITDYLNNDASDRILALMPFSFDYGLSQLTSAMYIGATLILFDYYIPKSVINIVVRQHVTGIPAVPHLWNQLMNLSWPATPHLRYVTSTGGRLHEDTINKLQATFPDADIYSMYGFTEAFRATYLPPEQLEIRPNSIGKAVPHAVVEVVGKNGEYLNANEIGELIQSGPLVTRGYWNDDAETSKKFHAKAQSGSLYNSIYAWSGDLAYRDDEGYFYYVSRMDDQIKLNGYRVSSTEIELAISKCRLIHEVVVICTQLPDHTCEATAFVNLLDQFELDQLTKWCKQNLPGYMIPSRFIILESIPLNQNGKTDKRALIRHLDNSK